ELTYSQRYIAHRYDCGRTMDVHSQSASRSHSKSIACPPVETSRLIFSNTDDRGFNSELTNSPHGIAKNLCYESTLMLSCNMAELGAANRIAPRGMGAYRICQLPLMCTTKFRRTHYRYCVCTPKACILSPSGHCSVNYLTWNRMSDKDHAPVMASNAMSAVGHRSYFKSQDLASIFVMLCQMRGSL